MTPLPGRGAMPPISAPIRTPSSPFAHLLGYFFPIALFALPSTMRVSTGPPSFSWMLCIEFAVPTTPGGLGGLYRLFYALFLVLLVFLPEHQHLISRSLSLICYGITAARKGSGLQPASQGNHVHALEIWADSRAIGAEPRCWGGNR
jgi:hypothetical protein